MLELPKLEFAEKILMALKLDLQALGVCHAAIFGSVARKDDGPKSDIDIYLDFGDEKPKIQKMLKAEGLIIEAFDNNKVDIVSRLNFENITR